MNMIGRAVDDQRRSLHFANDPSKVRKKIVTEFWLDKGLRPCVEKMKWSKMLPDV
jgi:hypothetical protein